MPRGPQVSLGFSLSTILTVYYTLSTKYFHFKTIFYWSNRSETSINPAAKKLKPDPEVAPPSSSHDAPLHSSDDDDRGGAARTLLSSDPIGAVEVVKEAQELAAGGEIENLLYFCTPTIVGQNDGLKTLGLHSGFFIVSYLSLKKWEGGGCCLKYCQGW